MAERPSGQERLDVAMADITMLILADHIGFANNSPSSTICRHRPGRPRSTRPGLAALADKLDVHAYIEEKIFYRNY